MAMHNSLAMINHQTCSHLSIHSGTLILSMRPVLLEFSVPLPHQSTAAKIMHYCMPDNDNQPQQQQCPVPTQQPPRIYCAHPPVHSCPLPPPILSNTSECHVMASNTQNTVKQSRGPLSPVRSQSTTELHTQTIYKILALLDQLQELTPCLLQLVSTPVPSNVPLVYTNNPLTHLTHLTPINNSIRPLSPSWLSHGQGTPLNHTYAQLQTCLPPS